jgi:hypothetical protein
VLHIRIVESDAAGHERVDIRRPDKGITERRDSVRAELVGNEDEDVRP